MSSPSSHTLSPPRTPQRSAPTFLASPVAITPGRKRQIIGPDDDTEDDSDSAYESPLKKPRRSTAESDYGDFNTQDDLEAAQLVDTAASPSKVIEPLLNLDEDQQRVLEAALQGSNIFLTAPAGCGKTVALKAIQAKFDSFGLKYVTIAPSGQSAYGVGGRTLHALAGWKPVGTFENRLIDDWIAATSPWTQDLLRSLRVLIMEEISMIENVNLERLNRLMQHCRDNPKPFGGVQIIVSGDFFQLPPVLSFQSCLECGRPMMKGNKRAANTIYHCSSGRHKEYRKYEESAFFAEVWKQCKFINFQLSRNHRQKGDQLLEILTRLRQGRPLFREDEQALRRRKVFPADIEPVKLHCKNKEVDAQNALRLAQLPGRTVTFNAIDSGKVSQTRLQQKLDLKIGAKVILLQNLDQRRGLVNGLQATVVSFDRIDADEEAYNVDGLMLERFRTSYALRPTIQYGNGERYTVPVVTAVSGDNPQRIQIPLQLAYSMTIHKSQGMTIKYLEVDLTGCFDPNQPYVALSRAETLEGLQLVGPLPKSLKPAPQVLKFYETTKWS
ncbi:hypothetical protein MRB53_039132 [Persea americana]|nr:hypothetical protein MRB53_039132 [Persea americana]